MSDEVTLSEALEGEHLKLCRICKREFNWLVSQYCYHCSVTEGLRDRLSEAGTTIILNDRAIEKLQQENETLKKKIESLEGEK